MILNACVIQLDEYSFLVKDITTQQMYTEASVDLSTVTAATLTFKNLYDNTEYEINILADWAYLLGDGLTINIVDFPNQKMGTYEYFPDYIYQVTIAYTYLGNSYTSLRTVGFRYSISQVIYQQLMQDDWKKIFACGCNCSKYSLSMRKFNWLKSLGFASDTCLIDEYKDIIMKLYKITNQTHAYS